MTSRHSRPSPATARLVEENLLTLAQLRGLVADLTPEGYRQTFGEHGHHTLGKHVRHIIDHYDALLDGLMDGLDRGAKVIDYEQRQRDEALEQWPQQAASHLAGLEARLSTLGGRPSPDALTLGHSMDDETLSLASSLDRELAFLTSHSIHHMAIIALLAEQSGIHLPESFGVHPSTLRHWRRASTGQAPLSRRSA